MAAVEAGSQRYYKTRRRVESGAPAAEVSAGPSTLRYMGGAGSSESPIRLPNDSEPDGMRRETEGRAGTEERQKAGSAADEQEVEQKRLRKLERKRLKKQQDEPKEEGQEQDRNHKQDAERRARKRAKKEQKKLERERLKQEGFHPDGSKSKSRRNGERRGKNRGRRTSTADNCAKEERGASTTWFMSGAAVMNWPTVSETCLLME
jgi:hypothetical protein